MFKNPQKTGEITEKRAKNGRFPPNARLNGLARFKTGDLATLATESYLVMHYSLYNASSNHKFSPKFLDKNLYILHCNLDWSRNSGHTGTSGVGLTIYCQGINLNIMSLP